MFGKFATTLELLTGNPGYLTYNDVVEASAGGTLKLPVVVNTTGKPLRGVVVDIQSPILVGLNFKPVGSVRGKAVSAELSAAIPKDTKPGEYKARLTLFYEMKSNLWFMPEIATKSKNYAVTIKVKNA